MKFGTERRKRWCLVAAGHLAGAGGLAALGVMSCVTPAAAMNGPTDPTGPLEQQVARPVADGGSENAGGGHSDRTAASGNADAFRARLRLHDRATGPDGDLFGDAGASVRAVPSRPSAEPSAGAGEEAGGSSRSDAVTDPRQHDGMVTSSTDDAARVSALIKGFDDRVLAGAFESNRSRLLAAARGDDAAAENSEASTDSRGSGVGHSSAGPDGAMTEDGKAEADAGKVERPGGDLHRFLAQAGDDLADGVGGEVAKAREPLLSRLFAARSDRAADDSGDVAPGAGSDIRRFLVGAPGQNIVTGQGGTTTRGDDASVAMGDEAMTSDQQGGGFTR
jgi:hypothetical protein